MAVNMLTMTPMASVSAKPRMMLAPKFRPNQNRMAQVMIVETLESRMDAPRPVEAGVDSRAHGLAGAQLLFGPFEDQDVSVYRHTDR